MDFQKGDIIIHLTGYRFQYTVGRIIQIDQTINTKVIHYKVLFSNISRHSEYDSIQERNIKEEKFFKAGEGNMARFFDAVFAG